jgi:hypothetical protein
VKPGLSTLADLTRVGPPFLHLIGSEAGAQIKAIAAARTVDVEWRWLDGNLAGDVGALCQQVAKAIDSSFGTNLDALDEVMRDPHWVTGKDEPHATVFVVDNAAAVLRERPDGLALWGSLADSWGQEWAQERRADVSFSFEPTPLHFIHIADRLPGAAPQMTRFELEAVA